MIQQGTSTMRLGWTGLAIVCSTAVALPLSLTRGQSTSRPPSGPSAHDQFAAGAKSATTRPAGSDESAATALYNRVIPDVSFDGVGLADVISFLREVSGANVFVDWKALDAASIDRNSPVTVAAKNVRFSKALDMVLQSAAGGGKSRLAYFFDRNVLTITTEEEAGRAVVTRVYNVRDIIPPGSGRDRFDDLIKAIENSVSPGSWRDNGGSVGSISTIDDLVIIVQTDENQRQVQDLLEKTRLARQEASAK